MKTASLNSTKRASKREADFINEERNVMKKVRTETKRVNSYPNKETSQHSR